MKCYLWGIGVYGAEIWTLRRVDQKYLVSFEMWCWRRLEKTSWTECVRNEEVLLWVKEKRNILLHRIKGKNANWIVISCAPAIFRWFKTPSHRTSASYSGSTARSGLWPVEKCPSICFYLSLTLSIFLLLALDDLFLLLLSTLSWVYPFVSSHPVLEWRPFLASYPPPFSPGDLTMANM